MTSIEQRQLVRAPLASAKRFLEAFFTAHHDVNDDVAHITLHAGDIAAREAIVTLKTEHLPGEMTPHFTVDWKDAKDGPYPHFHGRLGVESDEDYNSFWLVLSGDYQPPGGLGGHLFDAVLGKRIAEKTARGLLEEIARETERQFTDEETRKMRVT